MRLSRRDALGTTKTFSFLVRLLFALQKSGSVKCQNDAYMRLTQAIITIAASCPTPKTDDNSQALYSLTFSHDLFVPVVHSTQPTAANVSVLLSHLFP